MLIHEMCCKVRLKCNVNIDLSNYFTLVSLFISFSTNFSTFFCFFLFQKALKSWIQMMRNPDRKVLTKVILNMLSKVNKLDER